MSDTPIRDAASVVIYRYIDDVPHLLMGQRGKNAVFMPNKYVFPGGAVDDADALATLSATVSDSCRARLGQMADLNRVDAIIAAAIREVWEETGLILGQQTDQMPGEIAEDWRGFYQTGHAPSAEGLRYFFRAITPPGRPRRFDARFFLVNADIIKGTLDDFSSASDELSHLHWVALAKARDLNLPFITEVVLAEVEALIKDTGTPPSVPFFKNDTAVSEFLRIY